MAQGKRPKLLIHTIKGSTSLIFNISKDKTPQAAINPTDVKIIININAMILARRFALPCFLKIDRKMNTKLNNNLR